ncbi:MAG: hypothetical protein M5U33_11610 [Pseudorhodoplanes sp.]|nr:hypothetical protein [Pseudorhodoplanes sp.]
MQVVEDKRQQHFWSLLGACDGEVPFLIALAMMRIGGSPARP